MTEKAALGSPFLLEGNLDMENEFITADTHYGHGNVIRYSGRPFANAEEMDEALIRAWNDKVPENGTVYHLGDVSFYRDRKKTIEILRRLNGTKRLIKGNHDKKLHGDVAACFEWVKDYYEARGPNKVKVIMCHYPFLTWNGSHRETWSLHGHCHGSLNPPSPVGEMRRMDVGVDNHPDYAPFSWDEITRFMAKKGGANVDHHVQRP